MTIHPTHDDAEKWLRSGWDPEGDYEAVDIDGLLERLQIECDVIATIEPCDAHWL